MRSRRSARPAFTLIELLIVVAIISILAAIAVPNFLEAQTRARAGRAQSDLRAIATALETYRIDNNLYPTMESATFSGGIGPLAGSRLKWWYVPDSLSTPIAYLASAGIHCPFGGDYTREGDFPGEIWRRYSYENIAELEIKSRTFPILNGKYGPAQNAHGRIGHWRVLCIGPDRVWNPMVVYDPTNGTVSEGNLMRTQSSPIGAGSDQQAPPPQY